MDLKLDCLHLLWAVEKKVLLYILMLHLSGRYLCIMARHSLLLVSQIFTDFLLCARLGFEDGE